MAKGYKDTFVSSSSQIELQQLKYYAIVAEQENFSKAAELLYVTQPLLSQQISSLEKILGTKLLERNTKTVKLTAAGSYYYKRAKEILNKVDEMITDVQRVDAETKEKKSLILSSDYCVDRSLVVDFIQRIRQVRNNAEVDIRFGVYHEVIYSVKEKQSDFGFTSRTGEDVPADLNCEVLCEDQFYLAAAGVYQNVKTLEELIEAVKFKPLLLTGRDSHMLNVSMDLCKQLGLSPTPLFINHQEDLMLALESNVGFSIVPGRIITGHGEIAYVSFPLGHLQRGTFEYVLLHDDSKESKDLAEKLL